jgi:predicted RND superfamily exporter protein
MRERFDRALAAWGHFACRHAWATIAIVLLAVAAIGWQLPRIEFETSTEGFLHEDDPLRVAYDDFREQFGRDDQVIIAIETPTSSTRHSWTSCGRCTKTSRTRSPTSRRSRASSTPERPAARTTG